MRAGKRSVFAFGALALLAAVGFAAGVALASSAQAPRVSGELPKLSSSEAKELEGNVKVLVKAENLALKYLGQGKESLATTLLKLSATHLGRDLEKTQGFVTNGAKGHMADALREDESAMNVLKGPGDKQEKEAKVKKLVDEALSAKNAALQSLSTLINVTSPPPPTTTSTTPAPQVSACTTVTNNGSTSTLTVTVKGVPGAKVVVSDGSTTVGPQTLDANGTGMFPFTYSSFGKRTFSITENLPNGQIQMDSESFDLEQSNDTTGATDCH
jgi:hypothetical protein